MNALEEIFHDFERDLKKLKNLMELLQIAKDFAGTPVPEKFLGLDADWKAAHLLHSSLVSLRAELPILSGSSVTYLAGRFEHFMRTMVETIADEMYLRSKQYAKLPKTLQDELKRGALEIIKTPSKYGYDEIEANAILFDLVNHLKDPNAQFASIPSESISKTDANMREKVIADVMKRVGIKDFWADVGCQTSIKLCVENNEDKQAMVAAQAVINDLMDRRNDLAHPTTQKSFPDAGYVSSKIDFLIVFSRVVLELSILHLITFEKDVGSAKM